MDSWLDNCEIRHKPTILMMNDIDIKIILVVQSFYNI